MKIVLITLFACGMLCFQCSCGLIAECESKQTQAMPNAGSIGNVNDCTTAEAEAMTAYKSILINNESFYIENSKSITIDQLNQVVSEDSEYNVPVISDHDGGNLS